MGLDTSHNCWHGSYSSFHNFRKHIAKYVGIDDLEKMEGFGGSIPFSNFNHELIPLLSHSDCDGELSVQESKLTVIGLNKIIPNIADEYYKEKAIQFRDGCLDAISKNEIIDFH